jgi:hypothetical protein
VEEVEAFQRAEVSGNHKGRRQIGQHRWSVVGKKMAERFLVSSRLHIGEVVTSDRLIQFNIAMKHRGDIKRAPLNTRPKLQLFQFSLAIQISTYFSTPLE